jgi:uncharacterized surface protein with fasciclin (FAS1) repeats
MTLHGGKERAVINLSQRHTFVINGFYRDGSPDLSLISPQEPQKMMTTRRLLLSTFSAFSLALVVGCATTSGPTTIADTAARTPQLSTLNKLINDAGLADTLRGAGPFTVFAPSDEAFKAVPAKTMAVLASDKELLKAVLTYHVVVGKLMASDAKNTSLKTVQGASVGLAKAGNFVTVEEAMVTQADVGATNGVIHVIDKVLIPPKK